MFDSRSLTDLCCLTQAHVFQFCLSEEDLRSVQAWRSPTAGSCAAKSGYSTEVWCRGVLHRRCQEDPSVAQRVTDHLDLAYLDTIGLVRSMSEIEARRVASRWNETPCGLALPGILWALTTDPRISVHEAGKRLGHEALMQACRSFVERKLPA
ncbi:MAG: hypothetical protein AAF368_01315 [Planctomycetota bacterium]